MRHDTTPHRPRKALFLLLKIPPILLLCVFALAGALLWLRTDGAARFLADSAAGMLQKQGLRLELEDISGPLPGQLRISGLRLSDGRGTLFQAKTLLLRMRLSALLTGTLDIRQFLLEAPELVRLPDLPSGESSPEDPSDIPALPVAVAINEFAVTGGRLHVAALARPASEPAPAPLLGPVLAVELSGSASLRASTLRAALFASLKDRKGQGAELELRLDAAHAFPERAHAASGRTGARPDDDSDYLSVVLRASESGGGPLALLLGKPDLPGYQLDVHGQGPVRDWQGMLLLSLAAPAGVPFAAAASPAELLPADAPPAGRAGKGRPAPDAASGAVAGAAAPGSATLLHSRTALGLHCANGSFWGDLALRPDFGLTLDTEAFPGQSLSPAFSALMGDRLTAGADLRVSGSTLAASLSMDSNAMHAAILDMRVRPSAKGAHGATEPGNRGGGTAIDARVSARLNDMRALTGAAGNGGAAFPVQGLALESNVTALVAAGFGGVEAGGGITAQAGGEEFHAGYAAELTRKEHAVALRLLRVEGMGVRAAISGELDTETKAARATASLHAEDHAPWQALLSRIAGYPAREGSPWPGGGISLEASLELPGLPEAPLHGSAAGASFSGNATQAPTAAQNTDAPRPDGPPASPAVACAPGPATGELRLAAENLRWPTEQLATLFGASLTASARLAGGAGKPYCLRLDSLEAGLLSASGTASFTPGDTLEARVTADLRDIAPLAGGPDSASGPLSLAASVNGTFAEPELTLTLTSPELTLAARPFGGITAEAEARASLDGRDASGRGRIALHVQSSPGGPLVLAGGWKAGFSATAPGAPLSAALEDCSLRGAGADVHAAVAVLLDTAATAEQPLRRPAFNGTAAVRVQDWSALGALSGIPFAGLPATLDLGLANVSGRQSVSLKASLPSLRIREADAPSPALALRDVALTARGSDLYATPDLDIALRTGPGFAGPLRWSSGSGSAGGSGGRGGFALALRPTGEGRPQGVPAADLLNVQGRYDLERREILAHRLTLDDPASKTGLRLQKPLRVSLVDGIAITDADIVFQPSGRLNADLAFAPESMRVRASLEDLSFSVFRPFTDAVLPDGVLAARADFGTERGNPRGSFSLQSRIAAAQHAGGAAGAAAGVSWPAVSTAAAESAAAGPWSGARDVSNPRAAAASPAANPKDFVLELSGVLSATPGQSTLPPFGRRALPGALRLRGTGAFGRPAGPEGAREGALTFQLPLRLTPGGIPLPDSEAPLTAGISWNGPVETLWQIVPLPDRTLSGPALFEISLGGTLGAPAPRVSAFLGGAVYRDVPNGILIRDIDVEARTSDNGDLRLLLAAGDGRNGRLAVEAVVAGLQGPETPNLKLRGQMDAFRPLHRDDLDIVLSGIFGVNGPVTAAAVSGDILVRRGELLPAGGFGNAVPVLENVIRRKTDETDAAVTEKRLKHGGSAEAAPSYADTAAQAGEGEALAVAGPTLDIRIRVPQELYIRGSGLDSEWRGDLRIKGSAAEPSLVGSLSPVRGYFEFLSRSFSFSGGEILFDGGREINPSLNLALTYEGADITAHIRTSGTAKKPRLHLESTPPLPEDEVLAHVLFGKSASRLSRFEAIQLANAMARLAGGSPLAPDVITGLRRRTGLDMLRLGSSRDGEQRATSGRSGEGNLAAPPPAAGASDSGAPTLEAGKYINDSMYVGVEQDLRNDGTAVRVEVELFPSITLQGKSSADASEVGLGWKMDY